MKVVPMMLMLMGYRAAALALEFMLPSQLLATFVRMVVLLMGRAMVRRNVSWRAITVAVAHREDNRRDNNAHPARTFWSDAFTFPQHGAEWAGFHHLPVVSITSRWGHV